MIMHLASSMQRKLEHLGDSVEDSKAVGLVSKSFIFCNGSCCMYVA
jgi:hypothetical protein